MNLADKPVYPIFNNEGISSHIGQTIDENSQYGLTYKQWLVGMLASNPSIVRPIAILGDYGINAKVVIIQADEIIKELEKQQ